MLTEKEAKTQKTMTEPDKVEIEIKTGAQLKTEESNRQTLVLRQRHAEGDRRTLLEAERETVRQCQSRQTLNSAKPKTTIQTISWKRGNAFYSLQFQRVAKKKIRRGNEREGKSELDLDLDVAQFQKLSLNHSGTEKKIPSPNGTHMLKGNGSKTQRRSAFG